jgi:DNA-binding protein HU-beta
MNVESKVTVIADAREAGLTVAALRSCSPILSVWPRSVSGLFPVSTGRRCSSRPAATRYGIRAETWARSWSSSGWIGNMAATDAGLTMATARAAKSLQASQDPLRLGQCQPQPRDIAEVAKRPDIHYVDDPLRAVDPGFDQAQDPPHPRTPSQQPIGQSYRLRSQTPTFWTLPLLRSRSRRSPLKSLFERLAEDHEMTKKHVHDLMAGMIEKVTEHLAKGDKVRMSGIDTLEVRNRPARMGRNPATGESIKVAASTKIAFRASKELKEAV